MLIREDRARKPAKPNLQYAGGHSIDAVADRHYRLASSKFVPNLENDAEYRLLLHLVKCLVKAARGTVTRYYD